MKPLTNMEYKPAAAPQVSLSSAHYLLLPPILTAEQPEINTYFEQSDKYVSPYQYRPPPTMYNTQVDNSAERAMTYTNDLNSLFTQFDEFSFLHL